MSQVHITATAQTHSYTHIHTNVALGCVHFLMFGVENSGQPTTEEGGQQLSAIFVSAAKHYGETLFASLTSVFHPLHFCFIFPSSFTTSFRVLLLLLTSSSACQASGPRLSETLLLSFYFKLQYFHLSLFLRSLSFPPHSPSFDH